MRFWIAGFALLALTGMALADDLDDNYAALKEAQTKKDADAVKKLAVETNKNAKAEIAKPQPSAASEVEHWKQRIEFAKEVQTFAEYSLSTTAVAVPAKTVELVDTLLEINPKSMYLNDCASLYLTALGKEGSKKQLDGAQKIVTGAPNNEDALYTLAAIGQNPTYASRLVNTLKTKAKPEGMSDADWTKKKDMMLGQGYYVMGSQACAKSTWTDCDKNLRAALPYVSKEPSVAGPTYFFLGLANYNLSKLTSDRAKLQEAEKFSEQSAAIPGAMQQQAMRNVAAMKQELAAPVKR
jgi:hypothetical protein